MAGKAKPKTTRAKTAKPAASKPAAAAKPPKGKAAKPAKGKVKAVKPAVPAATSGEPEPVEIETFHVLLAPLPGLIYASAPEAEAEAVEFSSFDDARDRAIDHLIELIEEAERQLHILRRAGSHADFVR